MDELNKTSILLRCFNARSPIVLTVACSVATALPMLLTVSLTSVSKQEGRVQEQGPHLSELTHVRSWLDTRQESNDNPEFSKAK